MRPFSISAASRFFSGLPKDNSDAFRYLESLTQVENRIRESDWIDFKSGHDKDVEAHWGKNLSGFANTGGGLLVWGIQTTNEEKFDTSSSLVLVKNPVKLHSELINMLDRVTEPPVPDVQIREIVNGSGAGFVVAYIPESPYKPHQCRVKIPEVAERYYIRVGHKTIVAPHPLIRQLFYPQFQVNLALVPTPKIPSNFNEVKLRIRNDGESSAEDLVVRIRLLLSGRTGDLKLTHQWQNMRSENGADHTIIGPTSLHPEMFIDIGAHYNVCDEIAVTGERKKYSNLSLGYFLARRRPWSRTEGGPVSI